MISSSYGAALSGIQAASARLSASANNIANSDTPGYQRQQVTTTSGVYGVEVTVERIDSLVQPDGQKYCVSDHEVLGAFAYTKPNDSHWNQCDCGDRT